jgi:hypothetical protein
MATMLRPGEPVIDDSSPVGGVLLGAGVCGTVPRDYAAMPARPYGAVDMPVLSMQEIEDRAVQMARDETRLSDLYLAAGWENLNQNGFNFCWQFGPAHGLMLLRLVQNQGYVRLAAACPATVHTRGQNVGSWGAQGMENLTQMGAPAVGVFPEFSMRTGDVTDAVKANALKYRITEGWFDAAAPMWDRNMSYQQVLTLLACRIPVVADFDYWGHCVCLVDPVVTAPGVIDVRLINSWKDWGMRGLAVAKGSKARPDNAVAPRVATAA